MQATLSARISPWQAQPLSQAQAQWQALNLAALWPQAPQTQLSGQASVSPAGQGWQGQIQLNNTLPGPWNQQRLPLNTLQAELSYQHSQWALSSLRASGAGGSISGYGNFNTGQWQGSASLSGINPAAVDSRLASTALNGTLQAQSVGNGLDFTAQLQASTPLAPSTSAPSGTTSLPAVRLQSLQAQGQWADALLTLNTLSIQAEEAQLSGQLTYHTRTQSAQGKLNLALPGLQGLLEGQLASTSGEGRLTLNLNDASQAADWLKRWPAAAPSFKPTGKAVGSSLTRRCVWMPAYTCPN
jgi:translocation and assembly module TamB